MKTQKRRAKALPGPDLDRDGKKTVPRALSASRLRQLTGSRFVNAAAIIAAIVAVVAGGRLLREKRGPTQVTFTEQGSSDTAPGATGSGGTAPPPKIFAGEVYDTSIRLREAAAFGMAISLVVIDEYARRRTPPPDVNSVFGSISRQNLLPPGFEIREQGTSTPSSTLIVRYRVKPLAFEIVSLPNPGAGGPALMIRFPIVSISGRPVPFFRSSLAGRGELPEPFATAERLGSTGWTLDWWQGEMLKLDSNAIDQLAEEQRESKPQDLKR